MKKTLTHEKTNDSIVVSKLLDGQKNTVIAISGTILSKEDSDFLPIDLTELGGNPKSLRLDNVAYLVQNGMSVILEYLDEPYILPFEGKGKLELDKMIGLPGHELKFTFKGAGSFFLVLDISKLGV